MDSTEQWLRAEVKRLAELEAENKKLKEERDSIIETNKLLRQFINKIVWEANEVLDWQKKYFKNGRMEHDKKKSIEAEVALRLTVDKARKKNYGLEAPASPSGSQGKLNM